MVKMEPVCQVVKGYKDGDVDVRRAAMARLARHGKYWSILLFFAFYFDCIARLNDNSPRFVIHSLIALLKDAKETI